MCYLILKSCTFSKMVIHKILPSPNGSEDFLGGCVPGFI